MVEMTSSFELQIEALDSDHKNLIRLANVITNDIDVNKSLECCALVPEFVKLAKQHFAREEALLLQTGYPNVKKHHDHHMGLDGKIEHILEFAKVASSNPIAAESLKKELIYFLMDDVITSDMEFKDFVKSKQEKDSSGKST